MPGKRGLHLRRSRNWIADGTHSCVLLFTAMPGTQSQREAHLKGLDGAWLPGTGSWVATMFFFRPACTIIVETAALESR